MKSRLEIYQQSLVNMKNTIHGKIVPWNGKYEKKWPLKKAIKILCSRFEGENATLLIYLLKQK